MAFGLGLSFGKKKQSGTQNTITDMVTDLTGTQQQSSAQSGTTSVDTSGTTDVAGTQAGSQNTDQQQSQTGTNRQTGLTTTLGSDVIDALSATVKNVLGTGVTPENIAGLSDMISGRKGFNGEQFVADTVGAARGRGEQTLQESDSAFASRVGGTAKTNSMAALLAERGRNDLETNLAGIRAQATGQAEQISNQNLGAATDAQSGLAGIGAALAEAAKGGSTATDMTSLTDQISQLIGRDTSLTQNQQSTKANESSTTNQLLAQIQEMLTQQTERKAGTEKIDTRGKSGGFGISAGI